MISTPRKFLKGTCGASYVTGMPCRLLPRYHSGLHRDSSICPVFPHLGVTKLPPWVTVDGLPTRAELQDFMDAREVALALQAADIRWHSAATPRARRSYRAVHHGLDAEPYHAQLIGLWDDCLASIHAQLPRAAPTSGSAGSAGWLAAPAPADTAFVAANRPGGPSAVAVRPAEVDIDVLQAALDGYNLALAECDADARSISGGDKPPYYHRDLLQLWETYIESLAADLPSPPLSMPPPTMLMYAAGSTDRLVASAPAGAVAATIDAVSNDANVVGTPVVPAGSTSRTAVAQCRVAHPDYLAHRLAAPAPAGTVAATVNAVSGDANVVGTSVVPAGVVSPHRSRTLALQALDLGRLNPALRWHSAVSSDANVVGTSKSADAVAAAVNAVTWSPAMPVSSERPSCPPG